MMNLKNIRITTAPVKSRSLVITTPSNLNITQQSNLNNTLTRTSDTSNGFVFRPSRRNYQILSTIFQEYSSNCYIDFIYPDLIFQFNKMDKAFDFFMQFALNESNWSHSATGGNKVTKSHILMSKGSEFIKEWDKFMDMVSESFNDGTAPHHNLINAKSNLICHYLDTISSIFTRGTYASDVVLRAIQKIKNSIIALHKKAISLFEEGNNKDKNNHIKASNINEEFFTRKMKQINNSISNLFSKTIPKSTLTIGELYRAKTALNQTCGDFLQIIIATFNYMKVSGSLFNQIYITQECLLEMFKAIGVPFGESNQIKNENNENDNNDETNANETFVSNSLETPSHDSNIEQSNDIDEKSDNTLDPNSDNVLNIASTQQEQEVQTEENNAV